jgi:hypothetical protein
MVIYRKNPRFGCVFHIEAITDYSGFLPGSLLPGLWLPDGFLSELSRQWILFGRMGKGLVCPQEWVKTPFCRLARITVLSLVTLILLQKLFVPVSPIRLEKVPHIL